jgi:hypothetical protein
MKECLLRQVDRLATLYQRVLFSGLANSGPLWRLRHQLFRKCFDYLYQRGLAKVNGKRHPRYWGRRRRRVALERARAL